jgi:hypothetical protein
MRSRCCSTKATPNNYRFGCRVGKLLRNPPFSPQRWRRGMKEVASPKATPRDNRYTYESVRANPSSGEACSGMGRRPVLTTLWTDTVNCGAA